MLRLLLLLGCGVWVLMPAAQALAEDVDYLKQIKPLFRERCYGCHGALKQEANLRLDTVELMHTGGDSGEAIFVGDRLEESLILERVSSADESVRMPPLHEGELFTESQIELIRNWLAAGASAPKDEVPEASPEDHWSFRPIVRSQAHGPFDAQWAKGEIDQFISEKQLAAGLSPQPEASRIELIRRVYLDLLGVPPTLAELEQTLTDSDPEWYAKTVDRLLDDPRYGERWGRHWMDIWRYSDWWGLGDQLRTSQRHMWHFRDWIVESLNEGKPYDQMVKMMLAADELAPLDEKELRASGFLARNYFIFNRDQWMEETTEHVAKGLLGLTMNCSKCHDHKFDPLSQQEYYQFRAFFEPYQVRLDMVAGQSDYMRDGVPRVFDANPDAETYLYRRGESSMPDKSLKIEPMVPEIVAFDDFHVQRVTLPDAAWKTGLRDGVLETLQADAEAVRDAAQQKMSTAQQSLATSEAEYQDVLAKIESGEIELSQVEGDDQTFHQSFAEPLSDQWTKVGGKWDQFDDRLEQQQDGVQRALLRLNRSVPHDFEASFKFQLLGGQQWRSVGIVFDSSSQDQAASEFEKLIYLSGSSADSKLQATYLKDGQNIYPADGRVGYQVVTGEEYEIRLRVRGTLVNALVNGKQELAWRSPVRRDDGNLQLMFFDAVAALKEFSLSPLAQDVELVAPANDPGEFGNPLQKFERGRIAAKNQLEIAEVELSIAEARLQSVLATGEAMRQASRKLSEDTVAQTRVAAIRQERVVESQEILLTLVKARQELREAAGDHVATAQSKVDEIQKSYEASLILNEAEIAATDTYSELEGATWTATRFLSTTADDPLVKFTAQSSGRRSALANWVVDKRNPLTARVAVNHVWNRHFGSALVGTPFDLGRNGATPVHPELLDWLASEFMDHDWSLKHLHRLIMNSATYQMSSTTAGNPHAEEVDPDNKLLWRRHPIRLESQVVRDSVLALSGTMDRTLGGPSVPADQQENSKRRSIYFYHSNNERNEFLMAFDEASVTECYIREQSVVPQQALALANSGFVLDHTKLIAQELSNVSESDASFVKHAFQWLLAIDVSEDEQAVCERALRSWKAIPGSSDAEAREKLVWVLINHNDFVTLR